MRAQLDSHIWSTKSLFWKANLSKRELNKIISVSTPVMLSLCAKSADIWKAFTQWLSFRPTIPAVWDLDQHTCWDGIYFQTVYKTCILRGYGASWFEFCWLGPNHDAIIWPGKDSGMMDCWICSFKTVKFRFMTRKSPAMTRTNQ